jgi:plastocyanin
VMKKFRTSKSVDFKWGALALVAIVGVMTLSGASASPASDTGNHSSISEPVSAGASTDSVSEVKVDNFAFNPGAVTVKVGTQVTWINRDDIPHTVDSTEGKFKSAALDTDDKFQFRFTEPGEYPYYCRMHPKMTGKIIVQP